MKTTEVANVLLREGGHLYPNMTTLDIALALRQLAHGDRTSPEVAELLASQERSMEFEGLRRQK